MILILLISLASSIKISVNLACSFKRRLKMGRAMKLKIA
jgi:hypothetical protein